MTLNVSILNRDFTTPPLRPVDFRVDRLTWSAFGYCDQGWISARAPADRLLAFTGLLRCPVVIADPHAQPAWWGYVDKITVHFDNARFVLDLEDLYNRVQVKYAFISPDNKLADQSETPCAENALSQSIYGTREIVLHRKNIDDTFAENLRDTFLNISAWPRSVLSPGQHAVSRSASQEARIRLHCSGWFKTLDWLFYEDLDGFYANHGPGPGALAFGNGSTTLVAQSFFANQAVSVKYAYVMLRRVGSPTSSITAGIYADSAGSPGALLAVSSGSSGVDLPVFNYVWTRFTFTTPCPLGAAARYWLVIDPGSSSASDHYQVRIDENANFNQANQFGKQYTTTWAQIPSITNPGSVPDLMFRVVCVKDTGAIINAIAAAGNQFFTQVAPITSGVQSSPYRANGTSCLKEILALMQLGTANQRLILAKVNPHRRLDFYEQPSPDVPTIFMDRFGRFFTAEQKLLPPYHPPIGQFAVLSGIDRLVMPFDRFRVPMCFVESFTYVPEDNWKRTRR